MADQINFVEMSLARWQGKITKRADAGATILYHDTALPSGITGNFTVSVVNPDGTVAEAYVPAGAGSDSALGTSGDPLCWLADTGSDLTGATANGIVIKRGAIVRINVNTPTWWMMTKAFLGNIGVGLKLKSRPTFNSGVPQAVPVYADATARDAAIAASGIPVANGDLCYNIALGVNQQYINGAWANIDSGATVNASETVAGKIELATAAERAAGTATGGTGAKLTPTNDALVKTSSGAGDENKIPILNSDGDLAEGFIPASIARDTELSGLSQANAGTLTGGASSDADALHTHDKLVSNIKSGVTTRDLSTASGNQTIAHGLGVAPKSVDISCFGTKSPEFGSTSIGHFDGTNNSCILKSTSSGVGNSGSTATYCVFAADANYGGTKYQTGTITVDATNITIAWTKVGLPATTAHIHWKAAA